MKLLDLFSGIGGMSLGFEKSGIKTGAFCEIGKQQRGVLQKHWPQIPIFKDVTETKIIISKLGMRPDVIAGGDPCPIRSKARSNKESKHPDLSGYFLALVGVMWPEWVVRENVPASDDKDFAAALGVLGYRTIIIRANSFPVTAQNRTRDFIVGCNNKQKFSSFRQLLEQQNGHWRDKKGNNQAEGYPCLTTHRKRYDSRDGYIWDGQHLRVADKDERCRLSGFPEGWLDGLSETACAKLFGNSITPEIAFIIGGYIMQATKGVS